MHSISYLQIDEKNYLSLCKKWVNKDKRNMFNLNM